MAANATVFRDTFISLVPDGVRITSPTLRYRWWRGHPRLSYIRDSSGSCPFVLRHAHDVEARCTFLLRELFSVGSA
jgi:hypothetical protein